MNTKARKPARRADSVEASKALKRALGQLTLSRVLRSTREGEGLSQVQFAQKLGISKGHLCDIEHGRKVVSPARAAQFAKRLGYSVEQYVCLALQDELNKAGLALLVDVRSA